MSIMEIKIFTVILPIDKKADISVYKKLLIDLKNIELNFNLFGTVYKIKPIIDENKYEINFFIPLSKKNEKAFKNNILLMSSEIFKQAGAICMALLISYPNIRFCSMPCVILINDEEITEDFIVYSLPSENWLNNNIKIKPNFVNINVADTLKWIFTKTNFNNLGYKNIDILLNSFSYMLSKRGIENIIYAVLGLESTFVPNKNNTTAQLVENIQSIFPFINTKEIKKLYEIRSNFLHGDYNFPNRYSSNHRAFYFENDLDETFDFVYAIIILTFQKFVLTNSNHIEFTKQILGAFKSM